MGTAKSSCERSCKSLPGPCQSSAKRLQYVCFPQSPQKQDPKLAQQREVLDDDEMEEEDVPVSDSVSPQDRYPAQDLDLKSRLHYHHVHHHHDHPGVNKGLGSMSPEEKAAAKQRMKEHIQAFKAEAAEGIEVGLLVFDKWQYVLAKFTMDWVTKNIRLEADLEQHSFTMFQVQGVYNFWEASALWVWLHKCVAPSDQKRAVVLFYAVENDVRKCCLLEADEQAREMFVSAMTILRKYLASKTDSKSSQSASGSSTPREVDSLRGLSLDSV
eukprot:gnl/MRDRNA2_/MRDRNA2_77499_c2_seq1.p1 gnl/MRDRNA2_/MRDRNA2_77499_c2~~gnl/MRDRNA2_/MRDRNA2_77499_c2_seq1.p1  ORF type:complete len:271 (+),score=65.87 gnl/MRDRNA2_/MRDRNA2_77499_c2_seq1:85-897(+)